VVDLARHHRQVDAAILDLLAGRRDQVGGLAGAREPQCCSQKLANAPPVV
jgi:hypothetical protein